jgi:hypothetical protein
MPSDLFVISKRFLILRLALYRSYMLNYMFSCSTRYFCGSKIGALLFQRPSGKDHVHLKWILSRLAHFFCGVWASFCLELPYFIADIAP